MELLRVPEEALYRGPATTGLTRTSKRLVAVVREGGLVLWQKYGNDAVTGVVQLRNVHRAQVARLAGGSTMFLFLDKDGGVVGPATGLSLAGDEGAGMALALAKLRPLFRFKFRAKGEAEEAWLEEAVAGLEMEAWVQLARDYRALHGGPMQEAKAADTSENLLESWAEVRAAGLDKKAKKKAAGGAHWHRLYVVLTRRFLLLFERPSQLAERARFFLAPLGPPSPWEDLFSEAPAKLAALAGLALPFASSEVLLLFKSEALRALWAETLVAVRDGVVTKREQIAPVPGAVQPRPLRALKAQSGSGFRLLKTLNSSFESLRNLSPGPRRNRAGSSAEAKTKAGGLAASGLASSSGSDRLVSHTDEEKDVEKDDEKDVEKAEEKDTDVDNEDNEEKRQEQTRKDDKKGKDRKKKLQKRETVEKGREEDAEKEKERGEERKSKKRSSTFHWESSLPQQSSSPSLTMGMQRDETRTKSPLADSDPRSRSRSPRKKSKSPRKGSKSPRKGSAKSPRECMKEKNVSEEEKSTQRKAEEKSEDKNEEKIEERIGHSASVSPQAEMRVTKGEDIAELAKRGGDDSEDDDCDESGPSEA